MGHDGLRVGVKIIKKFVIRPIRICYKSVYNHPFLVGVLLMFLYLYRSFPFLFQLLVSASPVLVCTAVLLGTLLSFGEHKISTLIEDDDEDKNSDIAGLRTATFESRSVVGKDESLGEDSAYTDLGSEKVERSFDEEPLIDIDDKAGRYESHGVLVDSSMPSYHVSREIGFGKQSIHETVNELESVEIGEVVGSSSLKTETEVDVVSSYESIVNSLMPHISREVEIEKQSIHGEINQFDSSEIGEAGDQKAGVEVDVGSSHEIVDDKSFVSEKLHNENHSETLVASERGVDDILRDVKADTLACQERDLFDLMEDRLSTVKKIQVDNMEDCISGEGSLDAQIGSPLELSLGSWNHFDSDHDVDNESDSGSDGAESSSPDASLADIIPMLDELDPLLEDENPHISNLSCHGDESDQHEEEEDGDVKSEGDDDNEEEHQDGKRSPAKSAITWTEEDQQNLMELGTSDLERNQRLESLIARRRAKKMVSERNLLDLEGMDLSFPIAPISTTRYNPFDAAHDSYGDLDLPPIPGSAPSIMVQRRNQFDLPYDSSEEKPDLTGDSFQEEFMELSQRESASQRLFKRNETFSAGSSMFDFGRYTTRASRFRPYFVPERTDDVMSYSSFERQFSEVSESRMSYSSLRRQSSGLSESKASSVDDVEMTYAAGHHDGKKLLEHEFGQGTEFSEEAGHPSDHEEHESHSSDDVGSLSDDGNDTDDVDVGSVDDVGSLSDEGDDTKAIEHNFPVTEREVGPIEVQFVGESTEINYENTSSISVSNDVKDEDDERGLEKNQIENLKNVDFPLEYSLERSISDVPTDHSHKEPEFRHATEDDESHPKDPVYDSSPLAIKRNSSYSSICSDLQRKTSDIDLYHVQRDLFAEDMPKIHDKDSKDNALQRRQESDEYDSPSNMDYSARELLTEKLSDDKIPSNEVDQGLTKGNIAEDHLETSIDKPLEEKQDDILGDHVSSIDSNLSYSEGESKEETGLEIGGSEHIQTSSSSKDNHGNDASKELFFALDEAHFHLHDSPINDSKKQVQSDIHINLGEFGQVKFANVLKVQEPENNMFSSLLMDSSLQLDKYEKRLVSELAAENIVEDAHETKLTPESEMTDELIDEERSDIKEIDEDLLSELDAVGDFSLQSISPSFNTSFLDSEVNYDIPEEVASEVHCNSGIQFGDSTPLVDTTDVQNSESSSLTKESISDSHVLVLERQSSEEVHTFVADESIQTEGIIVNELNLAFNQELIPDLHVGEVASIDSLTLEDQSVEDIDAALTNLSKEEVQEFVTSESVEVEDTDPSDLNLASSKELIPSSPIAVAKAGSLVVQDELATKEVGATHVRSELPEEATEPMNQATTAKSLTDTSSSYEELVSERTESILNLPEEEVLDSSRMEPMSGISGNLEDLDTDVDKSFVVEALENTVEPGTIFEESLPLHVVVTDEREIQDASPADPGTGPKDSPVEFRTSPEDSLPLHIATDLRDVQDALAGKLGADGDTDIKNNVDLPVLEDCESNYLELGHQIERVESNGLQSLEKDRDVEETQELSVLDANVAPVAFVDQRESVSFVESESLTLNDGTNDIHESAVECQISPVDIELDGDIDTKKIVDLPVHKECASNSLELGHQMERTEFIGSESLEEDREVKETQELHVFDSNITPVVELVDQTERFSFVESESMILNAGTSDIHESSAECPLEPDAIQEPESSLTVPVVEANISHGYESEDRFQVAGQLETEKSKTDEDLLGNKDFHAVEASCSPTMESDDHRDINPLLETVVIEPEVGISTPANSGGIHVVSSDTLSESNEKELSVQSSG